MIFQETETIELKRILNDSVERAIVALAISTKTTTLRR